MNKFKNEINKVEVDEFGRVNALLVLNKREGITSHDLVDEVRKKLGTRRVGHAGALDPFATGLMLILVGKYTKLSDELMNHDKEYTARILFGVSTTTQDPEGEVTEKKEAILNKEQILEALKKFDGGYEQYVPVFSSVKVNGEKLRKLARKAKSFKIHEGEIKKVLFEMNDKTIEVEIPKKAVVIENIELIETGKHEDHMYADVSMKVSKGTYVRQFAEDLGRELNLPAMLLNLERTKIGELSLQDATDLDALPSLKPETSK